MKFVMEVDLSNAAFHDDDGDFDPAQELRRILREVARKAGEGYTEGMAYDTNGNRVGFWEIKE